MLNEEVLNLKVIKRNGKKVDFDGAKIALARLCGGMPNKV